MNSRSISTYNSIVKGTLSDNFFFYKFIYHIILKKNIMNFLLLDWL